MWVARQGVAADGRYETAFDEARARITGLLAAPGLLPLAPYYTPVTAPGYLPGILARHHLAPDGSPAARRPRGRQGAQPRTADRFRWAARGAYRHGVQRVGAP